VAAVLAFVCAVFGLLSGGEEMDCESACPASKMMHKAVAVNRRVSVMSGSKVIHELLHILGEEPDYR